MAWERIDTSVAVSQQSKFPEMKAGTYSMVIVDINNEDKDGNLRADKAGDEFWLMTLEVLDKGPCETVRHWERLYMDCDNDKKLNMTIDKITAIARSAGLTSVSGPDDLINKVVTATMSSRGQFWNAIYKEHGTLTNGSGSSIARGSVGTDGAPSGAERTASSFLAE